jgi:acyl dehydratase
MNYVSPMAPPNTVRRWSRRRDIETSNSRDEDSATKTSKTTKVAENQNG